MALCSRIVRKKKGGKSGSPNKNQGKEVGNGKISLLTLASFCWAKKFVSSIFCVNLQIAVNPMRMKTLQTCIGLLQHFLAKAEKSRGVTAFLCEFLHAAFNSSGIKISEVHLDMVNCGGDGDQYCPVRLLCPKKQTIAKNTPAAVQSGEAVDKFARRCSVWASETWKASVSNKETNHF